MAHFRPATTTPPTRRPPAGPAARPAEEPCITLHHCGAADEPAIREFSDAVLRRDYYFRSGHWLSLLANPKVRVYTIHVAAAAPARVRFDMAAPSG